MADTITGPKDFSQSSQAQHWTFSSIENIQSIYQQKRGLAIEKLMKVKTDSSEKKEEPPRCLMSNQNRATQRKRRREDEYTEKVTEYLSLEEECLIIEKYRGYIIEKWVDKFPILTKTWKIRATAVSLFSRFYLSNSVMEFEPIIMALASIWVASKTEGTMGYIPQLKIDNEVIRRDTSIQESINLDTFLSDDETRAKVLKAELILLEGIQFDLHCYHPYEPLSFILDLIQSKLFPNSTTLSPSKAESSSSSSSSTSSVKTETEHVSLHGMKNNMIKTLKDCSEKWINKCLISDYLFIWTPSQIAMICLFLAFEDHHNLFLILNNQLDDMIQLKSQKEKQINETNEEIKNQDYNKKQEKTEEEKKLPLKEIQIKTESDNYDEMERSDTISIIGFVQKLQSFHHEFEMIFTIQNYLILTYLMKEYPKLRLFVEKESKGFPKFKRKMENCALWAF